MKDPTSGAMLGIRPADGGEHRYYSVGIEHLAFEVVSSRRVLANRKAAV